MSFLGASVPLAPPPPVPSAVAPGNRDIFDDWYAKNTKNRAVPDTAGTGIKFSFVPPRASFLDTNLDLEDDDAAIAAAAAAGDDNDLDPTAVFMQPPKPTSVKHQHTKSVAADADAAQMRFMSLREVNRVNFSVNHGVEITEADEVDLDHTSCDELEEPLGGFEDDRLPFAKRGRSLDSDSLAAAAAVQEEENVRVVSTASSSIRASRSGSAVRRREPISVEMLNADDNDEAFEVSSRELRAEEAAAANDDEDSVSLIHGGGGGVVDSKQPSSQSRPLAPKKRKQGAIGDHGSVSRLNSCFLCRWGHPEHDSVNNEHMRTLLRLIFDNIGEIDTPFIAIAVHAYYKNVIMPAAAQLGQRLPMWRSKQVFVCIETHNFCPEIKLARDLRNISIVQAGLERKLFIAPVKHAPAAPGDDAQDMPNPRVFKHYVDTMKLKWTMYGIKMGVMNFHRPSADIQLGADRPRYKGIRLRDQKKKSVTAAAYKARKKDQY